MYNYLKSTKEMLKVNTSFTASTKYDKNAKRVLIDNSLLSNDNNLVAINNDAEKSLYISDKINYVSFFENNFTSYDYILFYKNYRVFQKNGSLLYVIKKLVKFQKTTFSRENIYQEFTPATEVVEIESNNETEDIDLVS